MSTPRVEQDGIHRGDERGHKMIKCSIFRKEEKLNAME
jgi:hypothetical protein